MVRKDSVLVIEPEPSMRLRICSLLEELGCETRAASSKVVGEGIPGGCDLIVWAWEDWAAWVGSGESRQAARQLPVYPRVVLLARVPDDCLWVKALQAGAFDFVEKPHSDPTTEEFRRVVASALGRPTEAHAAA